jgi:hypothetical protein
MQESYPQQRADKKTGTASGGEMVHVGGAVGIDARQQGNRFGKIGEIV